MIGSSELGNYVDFQKSFSGRLAVYQYNFICIVSTFLTCVTHLVRLETENATVHRFLRQLAHMTPELISPYLWPDANPRIRRCCQRTEATAGWDVAWSAELCLGLCKRRTFLKICFYSPYNFRPICRDGCSSCYYLAIATLLSPAVHMTVTKLFGRPTHTSRSLSSDHIFHVVALSAFWNLYTAQKLNKSLYCDTSWHFNGQRWNVWQLTSAVESIKLPYVAVSREHFTSKRIIQATYRICTSSAMDTEIITQIGQFLMNYTRKQNEILLWTHIRWAVFWWIKICIFRW